MSPRPKLTLLAAATVASLSLALPALAEGGSPLKYAAPLNAESPSKRAKDEPAPSERAPAPVPSGCPFRDGKLELIV